MHTYLDEYSIHLTSRHSGFGEQSLSVLHAKVSWDSLRSSSGFEGNSGECCSNDSRSGRMIPLDVCCAPDAKQCDVCSSYC
jgi:hypothetical protein